MVGEPTGRRRWTDESEGLMATNVVSDNLGEARENVSGWWNRARVFLVEVRNELRRVTWPTRTEVYAATIVVILFSIVLGTFLWIVDLILDRAVFMLFQRLGQ